LFLGQLNNFFAKAIRSKMPAHISATYRVAAEERNAEASRLPRIGDLIAHSQCDIHHATGS
jgi:hypothetical protein